MKVFEKLENKCEKKKGKKTANLYLKASLYFYNHTFTSFSSTGQKVLQRCPLGCFINDTLQKKKKDAIPVRTPHGCI